AQQLEARMAVRRLERRSLGEADERLDPLPEVLGMIRRRVVVEAAALRDSTPVELADAHLDRAPSETVQVDLMGDLVRERVEAERRGLVERLDACRRPQAADAAHVVPDAAVEGALAAQRGA